jgi:hypothetical protein
MITNDTIAKGWFLTYPKCEVTPQACLEYLKESHDIVEYVIAQELHSDGTPHLHAFIKLAKRARFSKNKFDLPEHHGNYQVAKSWAAVKKYVTKGGNYISSFSLESAQAKKAKLNKQVLEVGLRQAVDEGLIALRDLPGYVKAVDIYRSLAGPYEHTDVRGHWYVGSPGTGKSRTARERFPEAYLKSQNKWWDGY